MKNISEKYLYLPEEFHSLHDTCFSLVGQIEEFITNDTYQGLKVQAFDLSEEEMQKQKDFKGSMLDFLLSINKKDEFDKIITLHTIHGLIIDNCYFLQEALLCSKKMRLVVTFSLLRRPLVFNMVVILRLLFEKNFLEKYISGVDIDSSKKEDFDAARLPKDMLGLLKKADGNLIANSIKSDFIFDSIFNKNNPESLMNMSDRALHPVTTRNKANKTGAMNLNFVFSTYDDYYSQWDYLYHQLPAMLMYYTSLIDTLVFTHLDVDSLDVVLNERLKRRISIMNKSFPIENE